MKRDSFASVIATAVAVVAILAGSSGTAFAGPIFLTGHDPDFHAQPGWGNGQNLLKEGLSFVTGGSYNSGTSKFLWVESNLPVLPGHLRGSAGLTAIGLTAANYDVVDATGLASVNFGDYSAIAVASDYGGMLSKDEINALIARKTDITAFVNAGGGLFAAAECGVGFSACDSSLVDASTQLFGYLPVTVNSAVTTSPYYVTAYGASLGLTNANVNDPTHNSFNVIGGLNIVDTDSAGLATTLAGIVTINNGGFNPVPEPTTLALLSVGLAGLGLGRRKRA